MSRSCFVEDYAGVFGVKRLRMVLGLSRSGYYAWKKGQGARIERIGCDAELTAAPRTLHEADPAYGAPPITAELREKGRHVNHKRVERLMRAAGSSVFICEGRCAPLCLTPPTSRFPTCWSGTSPPMRPTGATSETCPPFPPSGRRGTPYLPIEGDRFLYLAS
ncbi:IS3 family transposase [Allosalinactinospora lopnorensis]|uniref:IS3 family transposase n=1 Tax=Allosalinactinospora lopnorensis TaxID=1352348 RepID=UPI0012E0DC8B